MLLWSSNGAAPTTTFDAGETYVVPSQGGLLTGSLVIYAADQDVGTGRAGCRIVSHDGDERVTGLPVGVAPVVVDGKTLRWVTDSNSWQPADQVTCSGRDAAAMAPFAVGFEGPPLMVKFAAVGFGLFAGGFGLVVLVLGLALRARASSAERPGAMGPGPGPGTYRPGPSTRLP